MDSFFHHLCRHWSIGPFTGLTIFHSRCQCSFFYNHLDWLSQLFADVLRFDLLWESPVHIFLFFNSLAMSLHNFKPLSYFISMYIFCTEEQKYAIFNRHAVTSPYLIVWRILNIMNFVRWSWCIQMNLYIPSAWDSKF